MNIRNPRPLVIGVLFSITLLSGCKKEHTVIRPMDATSPAKNYAAEFQAYRFPESHVNQAPDGAAQIEVESKGWLPIGLLKTCHTLSVVPRGGPRQRILTAREAEPGSGFSFGWGWSKDSKAVFIKGAHSGIDCDEKARGELNVIYTLADNSAWAVPTK